VITTAPKSKAKLKSSQ
jgi:hypothetical protein